MEVNVPFITSSLLKSSAIQVQLFAILFSNELIPNHSNENEQIWFDLLGM